MQELAVERRTVEVAIRFPGQEVVRGHLFLALSAKGHAGRETALDLMNEPEPFFVLKVEGQPPVRMVNKERVVEVELQSDEEFEEGDAGATVAKEEEMTLMFQDGFSLSGTARIELPPTRSRLIDFLNHTERFFALRNGHKAHIVNRKHISHVKPGR
jgi:hypothetical protein